MIYLYEDNNSGISERQFLSELPSVLAGQTVNFVNDFGVRQIVNLTLTNNRKIENAILIDRKYLVANIRIVEKGQAARDRCTDFSILLRPTIFKLFKFSTIDILQIEKSKPTAKTRIIDLETKLVPALDFV